MPKYSSFEAAFFKGLFISSAAQLWFMISYVAMLTFHLPLKDFYLVKNSQNLKWRHQDEEAWDFMAAATSC